MQLAHIIRVVCAFPVNNHPQIFDMHMRLLTVL